MAWDENEIAAVRRSRLFLEPPERVYAELREYGAWAEKQFRFSRDADLETHLLKRGDKLVNLGLAQFATSQEVVLPLYKAACAGTGDDDYDRAVRMAAISNRVAENVLTGVFGLGATPAVSEVLARADDDEIRAMLTNPLHRALLKPLYLGEAPFTGFDVRSRSFMLSYSAYNPGLNQDDSDENGPDMTAWDIQKALWTHVKSEPVDDFMARALHQVLIRLDPHHTRSADSIEEVSAAIERWRTFVVPGRKDEPREGDYTELSYSDELGLLIAAHFGRVYADKKTHYYGDKDSDDVVKRAAFYGNATLKLEDVQAGQERDGRVFTLAALFNESVFLNRETRARLEEGVGAYIRWLYELRCKQMAQHYRWFTVTPVTEDLALEQKEQAPPAQASQVRELAVQVAELRKELGKLGTTVAWGFIIAFVAIVYFGR